MDRFDQEEFFKALKVFPDEIINGSKLKKITLPLSLTVSNTDDFFSHFIKFGSLKEIVLINNWDIEPDITLDQALELKNRFEEYGISFKCTLSERYKSCVEYKNRKQGNR